jgi:hypothetical protein
MCRRWGRRPLVALSVLAALVVQTLAVIGVIGVTAGPASAAGGLRLSATTTYVVDPAAGAVHVTVDVTATNTTPNQRRGNIIEQAYYPGVIIPTLTESANFSAVSDSGASLSVTSRPGSVSIAKGLEVRFASNLFYNQTSTVHLHYDLPSGAPRAKSLTRVTVAFLTFIAWAMGDPGAANVSIVVPKSFEVDVVGESTTMQTGSDTVTYSATAIADPYKWGVAVSARNDSQLTTTGIDVDGNPVVIRAFPDDRAWGDFVDGEVSKGLPALVDLIGLPWPKSIRKGDRLQITETVTPYLYGYAGWYSRTDNTIEIGDALDPQVILHEVSHAWFNDLLFNARWIDEGLAQEYAARAVAKLGGKLDDPTAVNRGARGNVRLDAWSSVNLQDEISQARETYGYNAAWFVMRKLSDDIGVDGMRRVIVAAANHEMPYAGRKNPKTGTSPASTKRLLDYLDEVGGAKTADKLFATYVMGPSDTTLTARARARTAYAALLATGKGWKGPVALRQALTDWNFADAQSLTAAANAALDTRAAIDRVLRPLGLHAPAKLQADYEYKVTDLAAVLSEARVDLAAAKELAKASDAVKGRHGLLATVGLIGAKHHADLSRAQQSFEKGNGAASRESALAAEKVVSDASSEGMKRLGSVLGAIVLIVVLVFVGRKWRRRRAKKVATIEADLAPLLDPDDAPDQEPRNEEVTTWPAG